MQARNLPIVAMFLLAAMLPALPAGAAPQAAVRPVPGPGWTVQESRGVLWQVVRQCVRTAQHRGVPAQDKDDGARPAGAADGAEAPGAPYAAADVSRPNACARVDLPGGYMVLKDHSPSKPYAFLLLPTDPVTGIEDSRLWVTGGPNYWRAAYENRGYVEKVLKRPLHRTQFGFAANSIYGRSQDQLHIHITCLRPDVAATLARSVGRLSGTHWTLLPPMAGRGHRYRALLSDDATLARTDPARLLASDVYPDGSMLPHTLFMAPVTLADGRPGFVFLDGEADQDARHGRASAASNRGVSEELLDNSCAIAKPD
ncbi:CDP-diacylglycerol diphosphatase [Bordetella bronchialis]|nr:CDP-diacylglycerol diphosphatase [Bordetella bronchialis]